jgi:protein farnesyltransferase subunit beta
MLGSNLKRQPTDGYSTLTSVLQSETEQTLLKHIPASSDPEPLLQKNSHLQYLVRNLLQGFPARYAGQDASQPWLMYWSLHAFSILQVGIDPNTKQKSVALLLCKGAKRLNV